MTINLAGFLDRGDSIFDEPEDVAAEAIRLVAKAEGENLELNNLTLQITAVRLLGVLYPDQPVCQLQHYVHAAFDSMMSAAEQSIKEVRETAAA